MLYVLNYGFLFEPQRFRREVRVWQRLEHGNILPFFGLTSDFAPHSNAMVCPWLTNGNLNDYLGQSAGGLCAAARFQIVSYF
jgi:serine/threonine protein kinase